MDQFMREAEIPLAHREDISEVLHAIPITTNLRLGMILIFLHQCLNQKKCSFEDFHIEDKQATENRNRRHMDSIADELEYGEPHNTYLQLSAKIYVLKLSQQKLFIQIAKPIHRF